MQYEQMPELRFRELGNDLTWEHIIDKRYEHILLHRFNPNYVLEWWPGSLRLPNGTALNDVMVRQMECDLLTGLPVLKEIMNLNTHYLYVYQFDRPVPGTLLPGNLPPASAVKILEQNGLRHIISLHFEFTIVASFDQDYLSGLSANPLLIPHLVQGE